MTAPLVSIVVPTLGRPASLQRLLRSLSNQRGAPSFEVVVVVDGAAPSAAGVGDPRGWPFEVQVIESEARGAAAARNTGARAAGSQILLFVDDDVEVDEGTVSAHAAYHAGGPDRIGAGGLTPVPVATGFLGSALAGWWDVLDEQLSDPRHRFTFRDLLTGHCSVRRQTFNRVGGFDESLRCHEDFDFGYRALKLGLSIRRVPGAHARHHDGSTLDKILKRKREEGQAGVQLAERHPALRRAFPLGRPLVAGRVALLVHEAAVSPRTVGRSGAPGLRRRAAHVRDAPHARQMASDARACDGLLVLARRTGVGRKSCRGRRTAHRRRAARRRAAARRSTWHTGSSMPNRAWIRNGLRAFASGWAAHLSEPCQRTLALSRYAACICVRCC